MESTRPTLFVANHCSYSDVMVLGSVIVGSFVAKAEVARWPIFGLLAKLQNTVFVERTGIRARAQRDGMIQRLAAGDNLILFPEGTSDDGNTVGVAEFWGFVSSCAAPWSRRVRPFSSPIIARIAMS